MESLNPSEKLARFRNFAEALDLAVSRREFMISAMAAGVVAALPNVVGAATETVRDRPSSKGAPLPKSPPPTVQLKFKVNGQERSLQVDTRTTLLDVLRENLQLTGAKKGCDHGQCGTCTVIVDGKRINSCLSLAVLNQGKAVTTIEGLAENGQLHPMQQAFIKHDAYQCGYCTPGQIMSAVALLNEPCGGGEAEVRECMSGNICRCGAYRNILDAINEVRGAKGQNHAAV